MSPERENDRTQATLIDLGEAAATTSDATPSPDADTSFSGADSDDQPGGVNESFAAHSYRDDEAHTPSAGAGEPLAGDEDEPREERTNFGPFSKMLNAAARVQAAPAQLVNMAETANDVLTAAKNNPSMLTDLVRLEVERGVGALGLVTPTDFIALRKRVRDAEREAAKAQKTQQSLEETVQSLALRLAHVEQELVDLKAVADTTAQKPARKKTAKKSTPRKTATARKTTGQGKTASKTKPAASAQKAADSGSSSDAGKSPDAGSSTSTRQPRTSL